MPEAKSEGMVVRTGLEEKEIPTGDAKLSGLHKTFRSVEHAPNAKDS